MSLWHCLAADKTVKYNLEVVFPSEVWKVNIIKKLEPMLLFFRKLNFNNLYNNQIFQLQDVLLHFYK